MHNLAQLSMAQNPSVIGSHPAPVTVIDVNHFIFASHLWLFVVGAAQVDHSLNLNQSCYLLTFVAHPKKSHNIIRNIILHIFTFHFYDDLSSLM